MLGRRLEEESTSQTWSHRGLQELEKVPQSTQVLRHLILTDLEMERRAGGGPQTPFGGPDCRKAG